MKYLPDWCKTWMAEGGVLSWDEKDEKLVDFCGS